MLDSRGIRLFDYTQFVHLFRDAIRGHAKSEFQLRVGDFKTSSKVQMLHSRVILIFKGLATPLSSPYKPHMDRGTDQKKDHGWHDVM
jgi:hypothetical protein